MADISITASALVPSNQNNMIIGYCGETITAGDLIYQSSATDLWMLADADPADEPAAGELVGIAIGGGAINQPIAIYKFVLNNTLTMNAALTKGVVYVISTTSGKLAPLADLASGDYVYLVGIASSTTVLNILAVRTGFAL